MTDLNLEFELRKAKREFKTKNLLTPIEPRSRSSLYYLNNSQPSVLLGDNAKVDERHRPTFDMVKCREMSEIEAETQRIKRDARLALEKAKMPTSSSSSTYREANKESSDSWSQPRHRELSSSYFPDLTYYTSTQFQYK